MGSTTAANRKMLSGDIYKMTFRTDECRFSGPGQYALISAGGKCRPFRVCDYDSERFTIVFRESERGGRELASLELGSAVEAQTGLGNGFDVDAIPQDSVLVADSTGVSEMLELARSLLTRGKRFKVVLGFRSKDEIYLVDSFRNVSNELEVLTLDGSNGREGMASDAVKKASYICASGSLTMLKALAGKARDGQFSLSDLMQMAPIERGDFEIETGNGTVNCGKDGPVFDKNLINWDSIQTDRWTRPSY